MKTLRILVLDPDVNRIVGVGDLHVPSRVAEIDAFALTEDGAAVSCSIQLPTVPKFSLPCPRRESRDPQFPADMVAFGCGESD